MLENMTSGTWWKGALKGAVIGLAVGIGSGLIAAAAIYTLPATIFGVSMASVVGFVTSAGSFSPLPLMLFSGVLTAAAGLLTGGDQAITAVQQRHLNVTNVEMIRDLDGRTRALEEFIAPSAGVKKIIAAGPRTQTSYRDAEDQRAAQPAPDSPTIH